MRTELKTASFSTRLVAAFIDGALMLGLGFLLNFIIPIAGVFIPGAVYKIFLEGSKAQTTFGKRAMGLIVVDLQYRPITVKAATIRWALATVSSIMGCIGHLLALFTERTQAMHDLVAETLVVEGTTPYPLFESWMEAVKSCFSPPNQISELERIARLKEKGMLTDAEFEEAKKKILG